jgi:hypothetical protein
MLQQVHGQLSWGRLPTTFIGNQKTLATIIHVAAASSVLACPANHPATEAGVFSSETCEPEYWVAAAISDGPASLSVHDAASYW